MKEKIQAASLQKKYFWVAIITMTTIVYFLPYACYDFYNHFLETYQITDGQAGKLITFFGLSATPGYFLGGWVADKVNAKKLVVVSAISTGVVGLIVSFSSSFAILSGMYFLFGITTTFLHWSAFLKVVKSLGSDSEQGRLFGMLYGVYGALGIVCTYLVLFLVETLFTQSGFRGGIQVYSVLVIIAGILTALLVPYDSSIEVDSEEEKVNFKLIGKVLKMPITWYLGMFVWGYYMVRSTIPYLNPYMTDVFGISIVTAALITNTLRSGMNVIAGPIGGFFIDKKGSSSPLVLLCSTVTLIFTVVMICIPHNPTYIKLLFVACVIVVVFSYFNSAALYTPVTEARVSFVYVGTVLGIGSAFGYSTDIWLMNVCGSLLDKMGNDAYTYIWCFQGLGALVMIISGVLLAKLYKRVNE